MKLDECLVSDKPQAASMVRSSVDSRTHTVIDFLERPRIVQTVQWSTAQGPNTTLLNVTVPDILLDTMNLAKLDGFSSFSATVEFKVQINSQPFQAGLLILGSCPSAALIGNRNALVKVAIDKSLYVPHVLFDISKTSEITLSVPYVSPIQQYDLVRKEFPWADFFIKIYSSLVSTQTDTLSVMVWARFKDVRLGVPTASKIGSVTSNTNLQLQAGDEADGPVANVVGSIVDVSEGFGNAASRYLPFLKPFIRPGVAIARGVHAIIASLGWNKPVYIDPTLPVAMRPAAYFANMDGSDLSQPMSGRVGASLEFMEAFAGSAADEMSLEYLCKVPNYIDTFSYTITSTGQLWKTHVAPTYQSLVLDTFAQPTLLSYVSSMFMYWRGGLKYTFRFVKTDYHSGRLEFSFSPFTPITSDDRNDRSEYTYRLIGDLREQTEFSLIVPYVATVDYKKVLPSFNPLANVAANIEYFTGTLTVRALTPLQRSQAVLSDNISCVVEVSAAPDFELAGPAGNWFCPYEKLLPPSDVTASIKKRAIEEEESQSISKFAQKIRSDYMSSSLKNMSADGLQLQSGTFASTGPRDSRSAYIENKIVVPCITGDDSMYAQQNDCAKQCIGERIFSLREYMKRPGVWTNSQGRIATWASTMALGSIGTNSPDPTFSNTLVDPMNNFLGNSPLVRIANLFAFARGSINYKLIYDNTNLNTRLVYSGMLDNSVNQNLMSISVVGVENNIQKGVGEFSLPFYCRVPYVPIYNSESVNIASLWPSPGLHMSGSMFVSAGDDFDCGYLLGPPRCTSLDKTYVVSPDFVFGTHY
uniref:Capsid protein n=1 Tax=Crocidura shantungensis dicistrovirus 1 TaxID=3139513 RepID=A0AB38ZK10_9VIRU